MKKIKQILSILFCASLIFLGNATNYAFEGVQKIYLSILQGQWYDLKGNKVLDFDCENNVVNNDKIVGIYNIAGSRGNFDCVVRVLSNNEYKDLCLECEHMDRDSYHTNIILLGDDLDKSKGVLLKRNNFYKYGETIGGVGLGTPIEEVIEKYGKPDSVQNSFDRLKSMNMEAWIYKKLGIILRIRYNLVYDMRLFRTGCWHFDRTGYNCKNSPDEFAKRYNFNRIPTPGKYDAGVGLGHDEYMWFDDYPNSIIFSTIRD